MKTTVDIPDSLFADARAMAEAEGTTLRALIAEGLRSVVEGRRAKQKPFKLKDASVNGKGLQPGWEDAGWERVRDEVYKGRGG